MHLLMCAHMAVACPNTGTVAVLVILSLLCKGDVTLVSWEHRLQEAVLLHTSW